MIRVRPLSHFPPPETTERREARFIRPAKWENYTEGGQPRTRMRAGAGRTPVGQTLTELERELERLGVREAVLEMDVRESDLRIDGGIRASARLSSPRVVLSFEHPEAGPLRYPCDTYLRWEDNVRAIRLALEALRAVERYGVTRRAEQYRGWRALPSETGGRTTREQAAVVIRAASGLDVAVEAILTEPATRRELIRRALLRSHPDHGGSPDTFHAVQEARRLLEGAA